MERKVGEKKEKPRRNPAVSLQKGLWSIWDRCVRLNLNKKPRESWGRTEQQKKEKDPGAAGGRFIGKLQN